MTVIKSQKSLELARIRSKKYYYAHREKVLDKIKQKKLTLTESELQYEKKYQLEYQRKYLKKNKKKIKKYQSNYYQKRKNNLMGD